MRNYIWRLSRVYKDGTRIDDTFWFDMDTAFKEIGGTWFRQRPTEYVSVKGDELLVLEKEQSQDALEDEYEKGYEQGREDGYERGRVAGVSEGWSDGYDEGYREGLNSGG